MQWRKWPLVHYDVAFNGQPFPTPPLEEYTPLQYFKKFFDDALIDHLVVQTNLYSDNTKNLPSTDKDYDKLFKVQPVIESLKEKMQADFPRRMPLC